MASRGTTSHRRGGGGGGGGCQTDGRNRHLSSDFSGHAIGVKMFVESYAKGP